MNFYRIRIRRGAKISNIFKYFQSSIDIAPPFKTLNAKQSILFRLNSVFICGKSVGLIKIKSLLKRFQSSQIKIDNASTLYQVQCATLHFLFILLHYPREDCSLVSVLEHFVVSLRSEV